MKQKIKELAATWASYDLEGKLEEVVEKFEKIKTEHLDWFDFFIETQKEYEYYGESSTSINIYAYRWETDKEMETRISLAKRRSETAKLAAKRQREINEKKERTLYESLKKKFEKEING